MNKVDLVQGRRKGDLLSLAQRLHELGSFDEIFMISSLKELGTRDLVDFLVASSRERPSEGLVTMDAHDSSHSYETLAIELVKEQV